MKGDYRECTEALLEIVPRIKIENIERFIENVPYLSDLQREFYQKYIEARFNKLLLPAFVQAGGQL